MKLHFIYYLTGLLPEKAEKIFQSAEKDDVKLILPSISIGEAIYISEKITKKVAKNAKYRTLIAWDASCLLGKMEGKFIRFQKRRFI